VPEQLERRVPSEAPPLDPIAVERAYRFYRARRRARTERHRRVRHAGLRFWVVLVIMLAVVVLFVAVLSRQIEQLFGL